MSQGRDNVLLTNGGDWEVIGRRFGRLAQSQEKGDMPLFAWIAMLLIWYLFFSDYWPKAKK